MFGTFDTIHPGHIHFLNEAKKLGTNLTVVVARDVTVKQVKSKPPRHSEATRVKNIKKLGIANDVRLGAEGDKYAVVREVKPDVIALGYDQRQFVNGLRGVVGETVKIVRLKAYRPQMYKSSKLRREPGKRLVYVTMLGVVVKDKKVLLLKRKDPRKDFNGLWEFPGGGIEAGESEEQGLMREVYEESGFKVKILYDFPKVYKAHRPAYKKFPPFEVFLKIFICTPVSGTLKLSPSESTEARWCTLSEAMQLPTFKQNSIIFKKEYKLFSRYISK